MSKQSLCFYLEEARWVYLLLQLPTVIFHNKSDIIKDISNCIILLCSWIDVAWGDQSLLVADRDFCDFHSKWQKLQKRPQTF